MGRSSALLRGMSSESSTFPPMNGQKEPTEPNQHLARLLERYGELMDSKALQRLFGFPTERAFRRAAGNGTLPVKVFRVTGRPGWFARTDCVATWLATISQ